MANNSERNNSGPQSNQTIDQERAKAQVSGNRSPEQGSQFDKNKEGSQFDKNKEKGAIGGEDMKSQTGEQGRARNELDKDRKEPAGSNQR